jgi:hypothetical protein
VREPAAFHPDPWRNRVVFGGLALCLALVFAPTVYIFLATQKREAADRELACLADAMSRFHDDLGRWPLEGDVEAVIGDDELRCLASRDGKWPALADGVNGWGDWAPRDTFENHLVENRPLGHAAFGYPTDLDRSWRGPYVDDVTADPWGRKYVANVWNAHGDRGGPLWVLSAGPNGRVDTRPSSRTVSGDDVARLLRH